jgi:hypothetical protein
MIEQLRRLLATVDPAELTADDQMALLDLFGRSRQLNEKTPGGGGHRCPLSA